MNQMIDLKYKIPTSESNKPNGNDLTHLRIKWLTQESNVSHKNQTTHPIQMITLSVKRHLAIHPKIQWFLSKILNAESNDLPENQMSCLRIKRLAWESNDLPENQTTCLRIKRLAWESNDLPENQTTCLRIKRLAWESNDLPENQMTCLRIKRVSMNQMPAHLRISSSHSTSFFFPAAMLRTRLSFCSSSSGLSFLTTIPSSWASRPSNRKAVC